MLSWLDKCALQVNIFCPWSTTPVEAELHFLLPFSAAYKLHTANTRKFIQVSTRHAPRDECRTFLFDVQSCALLVVSHMILVSMKRAHRRGLIGAFSIFYNNLSIPRCLISCLCWFHYPASLPD